MKRTKMESNVLIRSTRVRNSSVVREKETPEKKIRPSHARISQFLRVKLRSVENSAKNIFVDKISKVYRSIVTSFSCNFTADLAQWQRVRLLISRFGVRVPGFALRVFGLVLPSFLCMVTSKLSSASVEQLIDSFSS